MAKKIFDVSVLGLIMYISNYLSMYTSTYLDVCSYFSLLTYMKMKFETKLRALIAIKNR